MYRIMNLKKTYTIASESVEVSTRFLVYQHGDFTSLSDVDVVGELFAFRAAQAATGRVPSVEMVTDSVLTACNRFVKEHKRLLDHAGQCKVTVASTLRQERVSVIEQVSLEVAELTVGALTGLGIEGRVECIE